MNPHLLDRHGWSLTAQPLHPQGALDVAQIQLNVPAASIQGLHGGLVCVLGAQQRGHQGLPTGAQFPYQEGCRCLIVGCLRHPVRFEGWLR